MNTDCQSDIALYPLIIITSETKASEESPRVPRSPTKTSYPSVSYYDIKIPEKAPENEIKICKYLDNIGVHISHPSAKKVFSTPQITKKAPPNKLCKVPSFLLSRTSSKLSTSSKFTNLTINVQLGKECLQQLLIMI